MSTDEAARFLGISTASVRRWIDAAEKEGTPVARRDRNADGQPIKGRHRRPFVDAVEDFRRRRSGEQAGGSGVGGGPVDG